MGLYDDGKFEGQLKSLRDKSKKKPRKKTEAELFYKPKAKKQVKYSKRNANRSKKK